MLKTAAKSLLKKAASHGMFTGSAFDELRQSVGLRYRRVAKDHTWLKRHTAAVNLRYLLGKLVVRVPAVRG